MLVPVLFFFSLVRSNVISSHYVKLYKFIFRYMQHLCIYIYLYISIPLELCIFTEPNWQNNWHFSHWMMANAKIKHVTNYCCVFVCRMNITRVWFWLSKIVHSMVWETVLKHSMQIKISEQTACARCNWIVKSWEREKESFILLFSISNASKWIYVWLMTIWGKSKRKKHVVSSDTWISLCFPGLKQSDEFWKHNQISPNPQWKKQSYEIRNFVFRRIPMEFCWFRPNMQLKTTKCCFF